jgi:hypothetical protein
MSQKKKSSDWLVPAIIVSGLVSFLAWRRSKQL